jgi:hypothetical protein
MAEVTNDELGRKVFQIQKERAVEETVDKIRQSLGNAWMSLPHGERKILQDLLGEAWITIGRVEWGSYAFSRLKEEDLERLIGIGYAWERKEIEESAAIEEVRMVLGNTL